MIIVAMTRDRVYFLYCHQNRYYTREYVLKIFLKYNKMFWNILKYIFKILSYEYILVFNKYMLIFLKHVPYPQHICLPEKCIPTSEQDKELCLGFWNIFKINRI